MAPTLDQSSGPSLDDTSLVTGLSQQNAKTDFSTAPLSSLDYSGKMRDVVAADFLGHIDRDPSGVELDLETDTASVKSKSGLGIHDKAAVNADAIEDQLRSKGVSEEEILKARDEVKHRSAAENNAFEAHEHQQDIDQQTEEAIPLAEELATPEAEQEPLREAISVEEAYGEEIALGTPDAEAHQEPTSGAYPEEDIPMASAVAEGMQDREAISVAEAYGPDSLVQDLSDPSPQDMRDAIPGVRVGRHVAQAHAQAREARISKILDAMADDLLEKMAEEELA